MQLYAPDDGREGARNMLSHTWTSSNKLVKLLHLVGWFILIVWLCTDLRTSNLSEIFIVLRSTQRNTVIHLHSVSCKVVLVRFDFSQHILAKSTITKFHENPASRSGAVPCGRTYMTKLIVAFRHVANAPNSTLAFLCSMTVMVHETHGIALWCMHCHKQQRAQEPVLWRTFTNQRFP
jgi:hypothetical protein